MSPILIFNHIHHLLSLVFFSSPQTILHSTPGAPSCFGQYYPFLLIQVLASPTCSTQNVLSQRPFSWLLRSSDNSFFASCEFALYSLYLIGFFVMWSGLPWQSCMGKGSWGSSPTTWRRETGKLTRVWGGGCDCHEGEANPNHSLNYGSRRQQDWSHWKDTKATRIKLRS